MTALVAIANSRFFDSPQGHISVGPVTPLWDISTGGQIARSIFVENRIGASSDGQRVYAYRRTNSVSPAELVIAAFSAVDGSELWAQVYGGAVGEEIEVGGGDTVVVLARDSATSELFVVGLNGATGEQRWLQSLGVASARGLAVSATMAAVAWGISAPSLHISALSLVDGSIPWSTQLPGEATTDAVRDLDFSPAGDRLFALIQDRQEPTLRNGLTTVALDAVSGGIEWAHTWVSGFVEEEIFTPLGTAVGRAIAVSPDGATVVTAGNASAVCRNDATGQWTTGRSDIVLLAYDAVNGDPVWQYLYDGDGGDPSADPCTQGDDFPQDVAIASGRVVVAATTHGTGSSTVFHKLALALDLATGLPIWIHDAGQGEGHHVRITPNGDLAIVLGQLLRPSSIQVRPSALALSAADGTPVWSDIWARSDFTGSLGVTYFSGGALAPDASAVYAIKAGIGYTITALGFDGGGPADTTPPVIDTAADVTVEGAGPEGEAVSYTSPTAVDDRDGVVLVTCAPASGSLFPIGDTTVTCTASDFAGNESQTSFTVTVTQPQDPDPPGAPLRVRCLHEPLLPRLGEPVTITAEALTADILDITTTPVEADEIEIWAIDRGGPKAATSNASSFAFTMTAVGQPPSFMMPYACRVRIGEKVVFSGWRQTSTVEREGAVPVIYTGPTSERLDIIFFPDQGSYTGVRDPNFLQNAVEMIREGYYDFPLFGGLGDGLIGDRFNFWIGSHTADITPDDQNECGTLKRPDTWLRNYAFGDAGAILHWRAGFRDCAMRGLFSVRLDRSDRAFVLRHEAGHRPFGLLDEYCCDGGYTQTRKVPNVYRNLKNCEADASDLPNRSPEDCRGFVDVDTGKDWFVSDPPDDDLMKDNLTPRASDIRRILWMYARCAEGKC